RQRSTMPKAAVDLPLPLPVWTTSNPFSIVLVAIILARAALRRAAFSLARRLISSSSSLSSGGAIDPSFLGMARQARQPGMGGVRARAPEAARLRLEQPRSHLARRVGIGPEHEAAHLLVAGIGLEDGVEVMVGHAAGRRGEGEEVVDRGRDLEGAL